MAQSSQEVRGPGTEDGGDPSREGFLPTSSRILAQSSGKTRGTEKKPNRLVYSRGWPLTVRKTRDSKLTGWSDSFETNGVPPTGRPFTVRAHTVKVLKDPALNALTTQPFLQAAPMTPLFRCPLREGVYTSLSQLPRYLLNFLYIIPKF